MQSEKLGAFYLGKAHDPPIGKASERLVLYDSKTKPNEPLSAFETRTG